MSTYLESDLLTHHAAGTLAFMAPEVRRYFLGEVVSYDSKADIWSLGALAVAMLTGNPEPRVATRPGKLTLAYFETLKKWLICVQSAIFQWRSSWKS